MQDNNNQTEKTDKDNNRQIPIGGKKRLELYTKSVFYLYIFGTNDIGGDLRAVS